MATSKALPENWQADAPSNWGADAMEYANPERSQVETMVSTGNRVPWHGLGKVVPSKALDSAEALSLSGLDWTVTRRPIFTGNSDDGFFQIPRHWANVRDSDGSVLGVVGERYSVMQNVDAFAFMDGMVGSGDLTYITAGSLRNGQIVWLLTKPPFDLKIGPDDLELFILLMNSHDGSGAINAATTPERVRCWNTIRLGLQKAPATFKIRHTRNAAEKMAEARRTLGLAQGYADALKAKGEALLAQKISSADFAELASNLFPVPEEKGRGATLAENARESLAEIYFTADNLAEIRGTKWGALNAVIEHADHNSTRRNTDTGTGDENRFSAILINGQPVIEKAFALLNS